MVVARAHAIVPSSAAPMSSASTGSSNSSTAVPTNPSSVMRDSSAPARRDELRFAWSQRSSESRCFRSFVVIMIMVSYTDLITALIGRRTCVQKFWNLRNVIQKPCMTDIYLHFLCAHYLRNSGTCVQKFSIIVRFIDERTTLAEGATSPSMRPIARPSSPRFRPNVESSVTIGRIKVKSVVKGKATQPETKPPN